MRKIMLTAFIAVITMINVNSQVSIGVKGGLNYTSIKGSGDVDFNYKSSYFVGLVGEFSISEKFSFQPELIYSSQGTQFDFTVEEFEEEFKYDVDVTLDYLNIPLIMKYYINESLSVEAGPKIGFLLSSEAVTESNGESDSEELGNISSRDFGFDIGMGYKLKNGINFGARYNFGLYNINETKVEGSWNNRVLQLSVGYFFN